MKTDAAKKIQAKRARRPIYAELMRAAVLETGEERLGWFAMHPIDRRLCADRKYRAGEEYRLEIKEARNGAFHRLAHAVGNLLVDNVESFEGLDAHAALKRVQLESGICCEDVQMDASPVVKALLAAADEILGKGAAAVLGSVLPAIDTIPVRQAQSLAFDSMDEDEFGRFFTGVCDYVDRHYSSAMTDAVRGEYLLMTGEQRRAA